ncbi:DNA primase [Patescibacteria group bacterium]|nr:DNA primase [Patescibacteria group bacterium]
MATNNDNVQQIKSRLDVVDVLSEYMQLKPAGQNYKGLCPFHNEKSPSFMVSKERQMWHCFGCNLGGDIFEFVQKMEGLEFPEALEILARKAGVTLQQYQAKPGEYNQRLRVFAVLEATQKFYTDYLLGSFGVVPRQYLNKRQVNQDSLTVFGLGYAPKDWDKLSIYLTNQGFSLSEIVAAGVGVKSDRGPGLYDRFRDRLMFPINDLQGRIVGFGGRTLQVEPKEAKYINSPQGLVYNKSLLVYNLDRAKQFIRELGYAVLVEGYMDVLACWQVGIKNVVATSGTALTLEQIKLIKRYTSEVRLAFDADLAGQSAAERGIDIALQAGLEVRVITLPQGKDPDDCARQDQAGLLKAVEQALPIVDSAFQTVLKNIDITSRQGQSQAADKLLTVIGKLPDPIEQDFYLKQLSRELKVNESAIRQKFSLLMTKQKSPVLKYSVDKKSAEEPVVAINPATRPEVLFQRLLALIIKEPSYFARVMDNFKTEVVPPGLLQELYNQLRLYYNLDQTNEISSLLQELSAEASLSQLIGILQLQAEHDFVDMESFELEAELASLLKQLNVLYLSAELKRLSVLIRQTEQSGDHNELEEVLARFAAISQELARVQQ